MGLGAVVEEKLAHPDSALSLWRKNPNIKLVRTTSLVQSLSWVFATQYKKERNEVETYTIRKYNLHVGQFKFLTA